MYEEALGKSNEGPLTASAQVIQHLRKTLLQSKE
jgi:hypothetical protein